MAVLGRLVVGSAQRLDLPDLLSIDSYAAGDWKFFLKGMIGGSKPYILKGFDVIDPQSVIGSVDVCSIRIADSIVFFPGSNAGSFYHGLPEGDINAQPLVPALSKSAVNYVYLTLTTTETSVDTRAFWDPDKDGGAGSEFTQDVNTESVLTAKINVSTGSFPSNTVPIAKITLDQALIVSIEDCRDMLFRLGSGGISPNPLNQYAFRSLPSATYERTEPPVLASSSIAPNPFQGADKNIYSMKEWMDAVMTKLLELGGTSYWYDDASSISLVSLFNDALATVVKSKGSWVYDPVNAQQVTWTEDLQIKDTNGPKTVIVRAGSANLNNEEVLYVPLVRDQIANPFDLPVAWTTGSATVTGTGLFPYVSQGDWVRKTTDGRHLMLRVVTVAANSITLSDLYQGTTGTASLRFDRGEYTATQVRSRSHADLTTAGGNFHWLATRSDIIEKLASVEGIALPALTFADADGAKVRATSTAHSLIDGDYIYVATPAGQVGTYRVEVIDANNFYIPSTNLSVGAGTAFYALATTAQRVDGGGFVLESANHGFTSGELITIAGTTSATLDGDRRINRRSDTQIQFAVSGVQAAILNTGTATLPTMEVRSELGLTKIVQGESIGVGATETQNIRNFVGMASQVQTVPFYELPASYPSLNATMNYGGLVNDSLTARASKLTAMMADKAQDKTVKYLVSGANTVANTTNVAAQEITFSPSGATLAVATPGSVGTATVALPNASPGISLLTNQVAYITLDRNAATAPSISIADIATLAISENIFVIAARLSGTTVYLWDGADVPVGSVPVGSFASTIVRQNLNARLIAGGNWIYFSPVLSLSADAYIQIPGLSNTRNRIASGSITFTGANDIAYVNINRVTGAPATLTVNQAQGSAFTPTDDTFIIARLNGASGIYVGSKYLKPLESSRLDSTDPIILDATNGRVGIGGIATSENLFVNGSARVYGALKISEIVDPSTTGANQILPSQGKSFIKVTNASLTSIDTIDAPSEGHTLVLTNGTGSPIQINNETGAVAANRVLTGTNGTITIKDAASISLIYDSNASRWRVVGGTGSGTGLTKATMHDPVSAVLVTGIPVTVDGVVVVDGDLVLFSNLGSGNNRLYRATVSVGNVTAWVAQFNFDGFQDPADGDMVIVTKGTSFGDQVGKFTGTAWVFNDKVRYFNGADYWEASAIYTQTLLNNTTANVFSIAASGSENIIVDFSVLRGSGVKETGSIFITTDGVTASATTTSANIGFSGVTFNSSFSVISLVGNIILTYTTTNTGVSGSMKYCLRRWSDGLGGPGGPPSYTGGTGTGTLQSAYNGGNGITTATTFPVTISGPVSEKLLVVNGDMTVTGVIDPKGITFSREAVVPLSTQDGLWVGASGIPYYYNKDSLTSQPILANAPKTYTNAQGALITQGRAVRKVGTGLVGLAGRTTQANATMIGIALAPSNNGDPVQVQKTGTVAAGIVIAASFVENALPVDGSWVYLTDSGALTVTPPTTGSGLYVVYVGVWDDLELNLQIAQIGVA
jgi:hypothetical protein